MPELQFKGKEFVHNHHLTVPYRPLEMDASKSIGKPNLNGNLVIHGSRRADRRVADIGRRPRSA
jgi:adenine-specific DNA-methyltransferase